MSIRKPAAVLHHNIGNIYFKSESVCSSKSIAKKRIGSLVKRTFLVGSDSTVNWHLNYIQQRGLCRISTYKILHLRRRPSYYYSGVLHAHLYYFCEY